MEFTNEIFFNKKLIANENVIITYSGKLYREHSAQIYIVYGFGENWDYTTELPMKEIENGFEITVELKNYNKFNFCFKNDYNIWDNNDYRNYIAPISQEQNSISDGNTDSSETSLDSSVTEENSQETENTSQEEASSTTSENTEEFENITDEEVETVFASLLDSILDLNAPKTNENVDVQNLSGFGLQSVDEIKEENFVDCDEIFNDFYEDISSDSDNEDSFTTNYENFNSQELEQLMDNLLDSILAAQATENENTQTEQIEAQEITEISQEFADSEPENSNLPVVIKNDTFLDSFLEVTYNVVKRIETTCKKIKTLVKLKAQEYGIIKEK